MLLFHDCCRTENKYVTSFSLKKHYFGHVYFPLQASHFLANTEQSTAWLLTGKKRNRLTDKYNQICLEMMNLINQTQC